MSVLDALDAARPWGVRFDVDGEALVAESVAGPDLPADVVGVITEHSDEIVALLKAGTGGRTAEGWRGFLGHRMRIAQRKDGMSLAEAEAHAYEYCVADWIKWLSRTSASSTPVRCAHCGEEDHPLDHSLDNAKVVPFSVKRGSPIWVHPGCWPMWQGSRRRQAIEGLALMGITDPKRPVQLSYTRPGPGVRKPRTGVRKHRTEPCGAA